MNLGLIELRHLRYFLAVAEVAHFTKVTEKVLTDRQPTRAPGFSPSLQ
jgi:hypothetical protein